MDIRRWVVATAAASILMGTSGYYALSSLVQRHETTSQFQAPASQIHQAKLLPFESSMPIRFAPKKSGG